MSAQTVFKRFPDRAGTWELIRYLNQPVEEEATKLYQLCRGVKARKLPMSKSAQIVVSSRSRRAQHAR